MKTAPFPVDPHLQAIAVAYRNPRVALIADHVLPRVFVGKKEFKYWVYDLSEGFRVPDTKVGRRSAPNEVEFSATEQTDSVADYGLDDPIPQDDIDNAAGTRHNPVERAVEQITDLILLDREKRAADLVFAAGSYNAACRVQLAGTDQWSDAVNSDPIDDIMTALNAALMRPNIAVFGQATWAKLAVHPKVLKAVHGNAGDAGVARRAQIAELFELQDVYVGSGWLDTSKKGQAASMSRVWGKHAAFLHVNPTADTSGGLTFGYSAEFGSRIAGAQPDSKIGLRGGQRVRVGESLKEKVIADRAGYFIQDAVA